MYQYTLTVLDSLRRSTDEGLLPTITLLWYGPHRNEEVVHPAWGQMPLFEKTLLKNFVGRLVGDRLRGTLSAVANRKRRKDPNEIIERPQIRERLRGAGIDLLFFTAPDPLAFEIGLPSVMPVHDLQHRLQPEFPEVSEGGEWEFREYLYRNAVRRCLVLLADSEVGKEDLISLYSEFGLDPERVSVLPHAPASYLRDVDGERAKERVAAYGVPDRFVFYPAQFWPHKNHERIIKALGELKRNEQIEVPIVFVGTDSGRLRRETLQRVKEVAISEGVHEQMTWLGYLPDDDMAHFYRRAVALVMPTFFGPSNLPILEAWSLDCPVLTSDMRGLRDQAGDAAVLVDPRSVADIAEGIKRLWLDDAHRRSLVVAGRRMLSRYTPDDFRLRLTEILTAAGGRLAR